MNNEVRLPKNINNKTAQVFRTIESEGHYIEAKLCNGYYGHALHVLEENKIKFECRFPEEKFIGVR